MHLPPHAYIPGRTPRHDQAVFDVLHGTVKPGMSAQELAQTPAWRAGLRFHAHGFHWEAHEALEPIWMQLPERSAERSLVQGIIQLANARLKTLMGKARATDRLLNIASAHFAGAARIGGASVMGEDVAKWQRASRPPEWKDMGETPAFTAQGTPER